MKLKSGKQEISDEEVQDKKEEGSNIKYAKICIKMITNRVGGEEGVREYQ